MERNVLVDKLKGYACFLVLFGHVIMGIRLAGVDIPSFFEGLEKFIWSFHVALFMFLSGVVYKMTGEWRTKGTRWNFILYKLLSLGVPYVVFSAVYIAINSFVGSTNNQSSYMDILLIWKTPVAQYWFLYALFFLFVAWALLGGILKNWLITLIVVALGYILPLFNISLGSFESTFSSVLAFGIGTFITFSLLTKPSKIIKVIVVLLHIVFGVLAVFFGKIEEPFIKEAMMLFGIFSSIALISLLGDLKPVSRFLLFINKYSFQIYLLHTIFTAGIRIILIRINVTEWWIHIVAGTVFGIAFSVLASKIAKKFKFLDFLFFPTKYLKFRKEKNLIG